MLTPEFDPEDLPPQLLRTYEEWLRLGTGKPFLPSIDGFRPNNLKDIIPNIVLTEVIWGADNSISDFVIRLSGSFVSTLVNQFYIGEQFSRLPGKGPGSSLWKAFQTTTESARPHRIGLTYEGPLEGYSRSEEIFLPFARTSGHRVDFVLVCIVLT